MDILSVSPSDAAKRLLSMFRSGPSVLFVGAFVSSRSPSGLPMALELKRAMVECMWTAGGEQLTPVIGSEPLALLGTSRFVEIPLELVAEEVLRKSKLNIRRLLGWLGDAKPNNNHRVLAALADRGIADVVTTNFDELIEREISNDGQIRKLHGTVSSPDGMAIRLNQVGRGLIDRKFKKMISSLVDGRSVCFVGYAARDPDIFPVLSALHFRQILWIARPYKSLADREIVARELEHCERMERTTEKFECLSVDGNRLFDEIGSLLHLSLPVDLERTFDWRSAMGSTAVPSSGDLAAISIIRILMASGLSREAAQASSWLFARSTVPNTRQGVAFLESESLYRLGEYRPSEQATRRALELCRGSRDKVDKARAFQILGLIKGRSTNGAVRGWAPRYMHRIVQILKDKNDIEARLLLANNFINLGIWQKNRNRLAEAEKSLNQGLQIARKVGDIRSQVKLHSSLGIVFRRRRQQLLHSPTSALLMKRSAIRHLRIAGELAGYLGDTAEEVRVMITRINLELDGVDRIRGALRRASRLIDECELLVKHSPEPEQAANIKEMRGIVLTAKREAQQAVDIITDALETMVTNTARASALRSRAVALAQLGLHNEALDDLHHAIMLVPDGPDRSEIKALLKHLDKVMPDHE